MNRKVNRNPRVAVTLSPEAMALLDELSEAMDQPKAALVAELVDQALPVLKTTLDAMRVVQDQPREAQRLIQNYANESVAKLAQASLDLEAEIDGRTVKGQRRRRHAGAS